MRAEYVMTLCAEVQHIFGCLASGGLVVVGPADFLLDKGVGRHFRVVGFMDEEATPLKSSVLCRGQLFHERIILRQESFSCLDTTASKCNIKIVLRGLTCRLRWSNMKPVRGWCRSNGELPIACSTTCWPAGEHVAGRKYCRFCD